MSNERPSLLIRMPNWVGDVVMALPTLEALQHSGFELQLLGKPWMKILLEAMNLPIFSLSGRFWQTRTEIKAINNTNKALLLTNSFSSALMTFLAGFENIGYKTDGRNILLKNGLSKPREKHEVEVFYDIARFASQYWFPKSSALQDIPTKISLPIQQSRMTSVEIALDRANVKNPFWVLCPFAHGTGKNNVSKIWPHWRDLSRELSQHHPLVVCPGKNEEHLCAELVPEATVITGLNLSEYAALLSISQGVIANDSGPMHLASAVGAKTLGIFGVSEPKRTSPWGGNYIGNQDGWPTLLQVQDKIFKLFS